MNDGMNIRTIHTDAVRETIVDLIGRASFNLPLGARDLFLKLKRDETSEIAKQTMDVIIENERIASTRSIPLCQDCGTVVVFIEVGSEVRIDGNLTEAVNRGVEEATRRFSLRASMVTDPLRRDNTGTNAPAMIHAELVGGATLTITVYLKGGGSENMTALKMFRPTETREAIIDFIEKTVIEAGPNPCPPLFLGVGIGGTADIAMLNSRKAVLRGPGTSHPDPWYASFERDILDRLNATGVGPLGFGGTMTVAGVFIREAPTHIATLPVALNLNCHSLRYWKAEL